MDVSDGFLSRLIGLAALILGAAMLLYQPPLLSAVQLAAQDRSALFMLGAGGVVAGLAIVLTHNVWRQGLCPLVVTVVGWFMLIRGVLMLFVPTGFLIRLAAASHYADYFYLYAAVPLVIGLYLCWHGFLVPRPAALGPSLTSIDASVIAEAIEDDSGPPPRHICMTTSNEQARIAMITLCIRYKFNPDKIAGIQTYFENEQRVIERSGGKIVGYFMPTDFAGPTDEAIGLIDIPSISVYEDYRRRLADDPEHKANVAALADSRAAVSMVRSFIRRVPVQ